MCMCTRVVQVVLVVEPDATKIETLDALKPPIRLAERKSSHDLLAKQCEKVSPKKVCRQVKHTPIL